MNTKLYVQLCNILFAFAVASVIMVVITMTMHDSNALLASLTGYSTMFACLLLLATLNWIYRVRCDSMMTWSRIWSYMPFLLTMLPLLIIVVMQSVSFTTISSGNVAPSYTSLLVSATVFIVVQMGVLFRGAVMAQSSALLPSAGNPGSGTGNASASTALLSPMMSSIVNLLGVISLFLVASMGIVLQFYQTQG